MHVTSQVSRIVRILLRRPRPFRSLAWVFLRKMGLLRLLGPLRIRDYLLYPNPTVLTTWLWQDPDDTVANAEFIKKYLRSGDIYVDVGANIGTTVIPAAKAVGRRGRVIAFEAHPRIGEYLEENVRLNGLENVTVCRKAVGEASGTVSFSDLGNDGRNRVESKSGGILVEAVPLDSIADLVSQVNLLKVDVEGYEKFVFQGGVRLLRKTDCVFFELSLRHYGQFHYELLDVVAVLEGAGFQLYRSAAEGELAELQAGYEQEAGSENAFAIRDVDGFVRRTGYSVEGRS